MNNTLTGFDFQVDEPLTTMKTIRAYCFTCRGSWSEVKKCPITDCVYYTARSGKRPEGGGTTMKTIREKCLDCCNGSRKEIKFCNIIDCPNWPKRFGKKLGTRELIEEMSTRDTSEES